ncbi:MAG TPA: hypothetical protein VGH72_24460 [Pseudonocardia sp.]
MTGHDPGRITTSGGRRDPHRRCPRAAGLVLLPSALVMVVLVPIAGRLYDKIGPAGRR